MQLISFTYLIAALIFNLLAQIFLKLALKQMSNVTLSVKFLLKISGSLEIWTGALLYGFSFLFYVLALSRGELSRVSPVSQALTTLGIVLVSIILFNEPITLMKVIGVILLIIGTIVLFL